MNRALRKILMALTVKRIIGKRHAPEKKFLVSRLKWLPSEEGKAFRSAYKDAINERLILRMKKRTGKGGDWHISLNPRKMNKIQEMIRDG